MHPSHINGYALALITLSQEEKKLEKYKEDSLAIIFALEEAPESIHLLNDINLALNQRIEIANNAFKGVEKNILNFLLVLIERKKVHITSTVLKKLVTLINTELGINEGVIFSVEKLNKEQVLKITEIVSKKLKLKQLFLHNLIDKELVAGLKIIVNDEIIEDTIVSRLENIKYKLLHERGAY